MANFWVVNPDGQRYGPADTAMLQSWTREGRVLASTMILRDDSQQTLPAAQIAELTNHFGMMAQPYSLTHAPVETPAQAGTPTLQHAALNYGTIDPRLNSQGFVGHRLSEFPTWAIVLLSIFVPLFGLIWFGLMHDQLPKNRQDDPGAGKAIGFSFIPFFNIWYWNFFVHPRLVLRINEQRLAAGLPEAQLNGLAMTMCILYACFIPMGCVPILNWIYVLSLIVVKCIFFASVQSAVNELIQTSRPGFTPRFG